MRTRNSCLAKNMRPRKKTCVPIRVILRFRELWKPTNQPLPRAKLDPVWQNILDPHMWWVHRSCFFIQTHEKKTAGQLCFICEVSFHAPRPPHASQNLKTTSTHTCSDSGGFDVAVLLSAADNISRQFWPSSTRFWDVAIISRSLLFSNTRLPSGAIT